MLNVPQKKGLFKQPPKELSKEETAVLLQAYTKGIQSLYVGSGLFFLALALGFLLYRGGNTVNSALGWSFLYNSPSQLLLVKSPQNIDAGLWRYAYLLAAASLASALLISSIAFKNYAVLGLGSNKLSGFKKLFNLGFIGAWPSGIALFAGLILDPLTLGVLGNYFFWITVLGQYVFIFCTSLALTLENKSFLAAYYSFILAGLLLVQLVFILLALFLENSELGRNLAFWNQGPLAFALAFYAHQTLRTRLKAGEVF